MNTQSFFPAHPVFTVQEFDRFLEYSGNRTEYNRKRLLGYHPHQGRLILIRPGLYGAVPPGAIAASYSVDSYLVAAHLTRDALVGYHSALSCQGTAHSLREERLIITRHPLVRPFLFRGVTYRIVQPSKALVDKRYCSIFRIRIVRQLASRASDLISQGGP